MAWMIMANKATILEGPLEVEINHFYHWENLMVQTLCRKFLVDLNHHNQSHNQSLSRLFNKIKMASSSK